jgi:hypothetical protein
MSARIRHYQLESRTQRLKLEVRGKPYTVRIAPKIRLGYRRNEIGGVWSVLANAEGRVRLKKFAIADDYEDSNHATVLTFFEAQRAAIAIARGEAGSEQQIALKALAFIQRRITPACYLYRHYHPNGDLLYVGISLRAQNI